MQRNKRMLSILLSLVLLLGCFPAVVLEAEGNVGSGTPDGEPPELINVSIAATSVTAPGTIEVIVDATDDVSGVSSASVGFHCEDTGKSISCSVSDTYYDEKTYERVPYADGKFHGTLKIGQYVDSGVFKLNYVNVYDNAGNSRYYSRTSSSNPLTDEWKAIQFAVTKSETPDTANPELKSIVITASSVNAPGSIEVIVDATDDVSGVSSASVGFHCEDTGKSISCSVSDTYYDEKTYERVTYPDGKFHGTLKIGQYVESGVFKLNYVNVYDNAGNSRYYSRTSSSNPLTDEQKAIQFTVIASDTPDGTSPELKSIRIATNTIAAPGSIEVVVDAVDDVSGVSSASVGFHCEDTGKSISCSVSDTYYDEKTYERVPYADGKFHGTLKIDQYVESGAFKLNYVNVYDNAGNSRYYSRTSSSNPLTDEQKAVQFRVLNAIPDVTTSVAKPGFVTELDKAADDAYVVADFSGEANLPETVFDALAGTDKTLDLVSEGVTWRFEGSDIVNEPKPIDLSVKITPVEEEVSASGQEIQEKLEENPGVVMKFAENGQLPGKATIQIKVDYAMREYLGSDRGLCVYYYNNQTGKLELIAKDLMVVNDTYIEFPITHCSYYVLTQELEQKEEPEESSAFRLAGSNRYETAFLAADAMKQTLQMEKFEAVVVASGKEFPDALAGSYLAAQKKAPILLVNQNMIQNVKSYIEKNLATNGIVYLLGGTAAVPAEMETALSGLNVKRLAGANRYETNLKILEEAGTKDQEILICTGKGFADSLSASAVNKPVLLVNKKLNDDQKEFLKNSSGKFIIIGGESAVSDELEAEIKAYGSVERVSGANRYETSVAVAKRFFKAPQYAVLAYAKNFPDGLCGGPLAYSLKAPLILTATKVEAAAADYAKANGITSGVVLGGEGLISDGSVTAIFGNAN